MAAQHLNLYDITIPGLLNSLEALSGILTKASSHPASGTFDPTALPTMRLVEDMHPFSFQIQTACNTAKFIPVRIAGHPNREMADTETTIEELQTRIVQTIEFLRGVKREEFEGKDLEIVEFSGLKFTALAYVTKFAIPNFYFHFTTAYDILRMKGVQVGKMDYLGKVKTDSNSD